MNNTPRYWYTEKRHLFGQRFPLTWEGWLVDAIWCASFLGISPLLRKEQGGNLFREVSAPAIVRT
jgi:hypothetical protein